MKIALFGGTFDPIHLGHLICAEEVREAFGLERVWFVPARQPPHKPDDPLRASPEDRYRMVCLAVEDHSAFAVSREELDREGKSYAIDTVRAFRQRVGNETGIYWILGVDSLLDFHTWREPHALLGLCTLVAVTRPQYDPGLIPESLRGRVRLFPTTELGISATDIRERVRAGRSIRYRTPPPVERYIREHGLYHA
jgi:nicotinate-nucleotide adenylyltransferase